MFSFEPSDHFFFFTKLGMDVTIVGHPSDVLMFTFSVNNRFVDRKGTVLLNLGSLFV
jgi:hypothetical protein